MIPLQGIAGLEVPFGTVLVLFHAFEGSKIENIGPDRSIV